MKNLIPAFLLAALSTCALPEPNPRTLLCVEWKPFVSRQVAGGQVIEEGIAYWSCEQYKWVLREEVDSEPVLRREVGQ